MWVVGVCVCVCVCVNPIEGLCGGGGIGGAWLEIARACGKRERAARRCARTCVWIRKAAGGRRPALRRSPGPTIQIGANFGRRFRAGGGGGRDLVSAAISEYRGWGSRRRFGASMP